MTAKYIIDLARQRLGDVDKHRWTEARLLTIVSQGQADICKRTGFIRKEAVLPLVDKVLRYRLPSDCYQVKRMEYQGDIIPLYTRNDRDGQPRGYTADFVAIKSNLNLDFVDIYPKVPSLDDPIVIVEGDPTTDTFTVVPPLGVASNANSGYVIAPTYGVTTGVELDMSDNLINQGYGEVTGSTLAQYTVTGDSNGVLTALGYSNDLTNNNLGFLTDFHTEGFKVSGVYGISADIVNEKDTMVLFYTAIPPVIVGVNSTLAIPYMWESTFLKYVVGTALQDDNDANNIQRGELELSKYNTEVEALADSTSTDFSGNAGSKYITDYRNI